MDYDNDIPPVLILIMATAGLFFTLGFTNGQSMKRFALVVLLALVGCSVDTELSTKRIAKNESRGDIVEHWGHCVGDGVPHRMSILRDGTEILTVGQHDHGRWLLMVRYHGEQRFQVISDEGKINELKAKENQ